MVDTHIHEAQTSKYDKEYDIDGDGKVTDREVSVYERKMRAQRRMATWSLVAMVGFTAILFTPVISIERVNAIGELIGLFYISMAGIVGAYMGISGWMNRK